MREPWKIPYGISDNIRLARGAVDRIALPKRIRIRVKAVSLQPLVRRGNRERGRICS
jgi:hypothetical protein